MVMEQHGVKWLQKGTHEKHLSVLDFEKQERAKEVAELDSQKQEKTSEVAKLNQAVSSMKQELMTTKERYKKWTGNSFNDKAILENDEKRALLISATGTGKTYASAFAMRELGFKRVLFLVHRASLAVQAKKSYQRVFGSTISVGLVGAGYHEYDRDYIFATVETLNRDVHLQMYDPAEFDCIILDEAHHSSANTYQKVMNYFTPRLFLGMTATPDKRNDNDSGENIYEIFNHQIAYEIRLQQAMEEDLLCPFHYFGITDLSVVQDTKSKNLSEEDFNKLVCDERVKLVIEQSNYYGYSGERVKGLIFCSRNRECKELSKKFNELGYQF